MDNAGINSTDLGGVVPYTGRSRNQQVVDVDGDDNNGESAAARRRCQ